MKHTDNSTDHRQAAHDLMVQSYTAPDDATRRALELEAAKHTALADAKDLIEEEKRKKMIGRNK